MHNDWADRDVLLRGQGHDEDHPERATGVVGHSYGAMLATRVAVAQQVHAVVALSAARKGWANDEGLEEPLANLDMRSMHVWGTDTEDTDGGSDALTPDRWDAIPGTKHRVILDGAGHWDYFSGQHDGCSPTSWQANTVRGALARDLVTTFFARYLPLPVDVGGLRAPISLSHRVQP